MRNWWRDSVTKRLKRLDLALQVAAVLGISIFLIFVIALIKLIIAEGLNEEFTYFNPQEASSCGCGESIMFKPRAQENEIRAIRIL